ALRLDLNAPSGPAVTLDRGALRAALAGQLDGTQRRARDARLTVVDGAPSVQPSAAGTRIDWTRTLDRLVRAAATPGRRMITVAYAPVPPSVSTADVRALGVREVVARFTTGGFVDAVRPNLRAAARAVDGTLVRPGATFDLEEHTGPRTRSRGYVRAPLREDGTGPETIGGGVNQFTSTLVNAVHRAGITDVERTPQPHPLDRYPAGRDAVSLAGDGSTVDFSFTNDAPTAVFLRAWVGDSTVTVEIWGSRR
ncbi:VanW family protein, partial [Saccharomonospora iraqiensis]|uniref:VanW family protein n=1 Tax=Saccharomonospora iraqiensis TaxID=52698 RepID=UPI0018EF6C26